MYQIQVTERTLHFKQPAGTSRGIYTTRKSWFVEISDGHRVGIGECAPLPDLSCDAIPDYGQVLRTFCHELEQQLNQGEPSPLTSHLSPLTSELSPLQSYPSMLFGLETALLHLQSPKPDEALPVLFDNAFSRGERGIRINGLVWMGSHDEMLARMEKKLEQGFRCIKIKIGAIGFDDELDLLRRLRDCFSADEVEIRVDANGAFTFDEAFDRLVSLSQLDLHSIEQPIRAGEWGDMAELCLNTPLPIALDEELIGVNTAEQKAQLLDIIKPQYIILKPSLHGGMHGCREWIRLARERGVKSWMTSALESNVGLNAIAQLAADIYGEPVTMPQGLGTGQLFTDNIPMPLEVRGEQLWRKQL